MVVVDNERWSLARMTLHLLYQAFYCCNAVLSFKLNNEKAIVQTPLLI